LSLRSFDYAMVTVFLAEIMGNMLDDRSMKVAKL